MVVLGKIRLEFLGFVRRDMDKVPDSDLAKSDESLARVPPKQSEERPTSADCLEPGAGCSMG